MDVGGGGECDFEADSTDSWGRQEPRTTPSNTSQPFQRALRMDAIAVPLIFDNVFALLCQRDKRHLRLTCKTTRRLVDERVRRVELYLDAGRTPEVLGQVAQGSRLRPTTLLLRGLCRVEGDGWSYDTDESQDYGASDPISTVLRDHRLHELCSKVQELQLTSRKPWATYDDSISKELVCSVAPTSLTSGCMMHAHSYP